MNAALQSAECELAAIDRLLDSPTLVKSPYNLKMRK